MTIDPDSRVALAEIKGDVKLILAGQERTHSDVKAINNRLDRHEGRLGVLELDKSAREGERKGIGLTSKIVWSVVSFIIGSGGVFALVELLK